MEGKEAMLLVADVGNTHTVIGLYDKDKLLSHWRISTDLRKTEDEFAMIIKSSELTYAFRIHNFNYFILIMWMLKNNL